MFDELQSRVANKKVLILGLGNCSRGDEGVGCYLVKQLDGIVKVPLIDGGLVPEKQLGRIEASHAELLIVIAAADIPEAGPGEIGLFSLDEIYSVGVVLRTANISELLKFIPKVARPEVLLLAVQPDNQGDRKGVSDALQNALDGLEALFVDLFGE